MPPSSALKLLISRLNRTAPTVRPSTPRNKSFESPDHTGLAVALRILPLPSSGSRPAGPTRALPPFDAGRKEIVRLAAEYRLAAMYEHRAFVEVGGLMSYGPNIDQLS
jgi:hypothetical protein